MKGGHERKAQRKASHGKEGRMASVLSSFVSSFHGFLSMSSFLGQGKEGIKEGMKCQ